MDPEIKKILDNHEERIKKLEVQPFEKGKGKETIISKEKLKGIPKGVKELIESEFFNKPKNINDAVKELARKGYFASRETIDRTIRRDFFKKKGILTRIKEEKIWKYVLKK